MLNINIGFILWETVWTTGHDPTIPASFISHQFDSYELNKLMDIDILEIT